MSAQSAFGLPRRFCQTAHRPTTRFSRGRACVAAALAALCLITQAPPVEAASRIPSGVIRCDDRSSGLWTAQPAFSQGRQRPTATPLPDGRIAVVGGNDNDRMVGSDFGALKTAELWDPAAPRSAHALPPLAKPGLEHTATLLRDGRIAVVGGTSGRGTICPDSIQLLEKRDAGWTWTEGPRLHTPRFRHSALLLDDGRLMIIGGLTCAPPERPVSLAELWDTRAQTLQELPEPALSTGATPSAAYPLSHGRVVVLNTTGEFAIWNPRTKRWTEGPLVPGAGPGPLAATGVPRPGLFASAQLPDRTVVAFVNPAHGEVTILTLRGGDHWRRQGVVSLDVAGAAQAATLSDGSVLILSAIRGWVWRFVPSDWSCQRVAQSLDWWDSAGATLVPLPHSQAALLGARQGFAEVLDLNGKTDGRWSSRSPQGVAPDAWRAFIGVRADAYVLPDGRVLELSGKTSRVWDPTQDSVSLDAEMSVDRLQGITAVLHDGRVLRAFGLDARIPSPPSNARVAGWGIWGGGDVSPPNLAKTAELFSPASGRWSPLRAFDDLRVEPAAAVLPDGQVLVAGGGRLLYGPVPRGSNAIGLEYAEKGPLPLRSTKVWEPSTGAWHSGAELPKESYGMAAISLQDGRVFTICGSPDSRAGQVYEPARGRWFSTRPMPLESKPCDAVALADGRVLVVGDALAQVWDPRADTWRTVNPPRYRGSAAVRLTDGRVFRGGIQPEIWDPARDLWTPTAAPLDRDDLRSCAPLALRDGRVLVCNEIWSPGAAAETRYSKSVPSIPLDR